MTTPSALSTHETRNRLHELTVIDVRTPGEYAGGHLPGALNIPLDRIQRALTDVRQAADRGEVLIVCASGARSENACRILAENGITTATLSGGTSAWAAEGHDLHRPEGNPRATWGMERQVRLTAGTVVLLGLLLGLLVHPAFQILSAGIAAGLVFSALTNTCGMAALLAKLPHNRTGAADLDATLAALRGRR
ncbi:rhodanese-like domain-containing protein [Streptomyces sp. Tu10]|uniref:rhodanese-like domain-containing protein n=1 Tax=Streptomyces TaxID=1883 RepID=UPI001BDDBA24|nr:rhodanese-like domain-containing protein [Streptomyces sp. Tu10]MBT1100275.1 rhodanese-like domain-containing protein [Streptomyces sp. Tu10]WTC61537.1 rhodanese-like domain-containing protein [Streptomyces anulatus]WTC75467.1 rhodanese-like domain-containing protein [Streptomyces anulatus]